MPKFNVAYLRKALTDADLKDHSSTKRLLDNFVALAQRELPDLIKFAEQWRDGGTLPHKLQEQCKRALEKCKLAQALLEQIIAHQNVKKLIGELEHIHGTYVVFDTLKQSELPMPILIG